jgi:ribose-phosphate pyrophosphokinase
MTRPVVLSFPGNDTMADAIARSLGAERVAVHLRRFPDGETLASLDAAGASGLAGRDVVLVATLDRPDPKLVPVALIAGAARDHGARRVVLVAPYLAYLRQDAVFAPGQGVSARHFARLVAAAADALVVVDPHLHRLDSLDDVFGIPSRVVQSAPALARWVAAHVERPVLVGPDEESAQWVSEVAHRAGCPHVVLRKIRRGDRDVEVSAPGLDPADGRTPVIVDDIASTGHTIAQAVRGLVRAGHPAPLCVAVHGVFADDALAVLRTAGVARVVTTNTIPHPTNAIDVSGLVAEGAAELLAAPLADRPPAAEDRATA